MKHHFRIRHRGNGEPYTIDFLVLVKSFGFEVAVRVEREDAIGSTIKRALDSKAPAVVEVPITRDPTIASANIVGWWDVSPVPTAPDVVKADYAAGLSAEQHEGRDTSTISMIEASGAVG